MPTACGPLAHTAPTHGVLPDTGVIARFNGTQWRVAEPDYAQHELLVALWLEVRQLRHVVQTATGIDLNEDEAVSV